MITKILIILLFLTFSIFSAQNNIEIIDQNIDTGFIDIGNCEIILKNNNIFIAKVKMRLNFPVFGKNYHQRKLYLKDGYDKKEIDISEVSELWLEKVLYPHRGILMIKTKDNKEYTLKNFIVSREPIQIISESKSIFNLKLQQIKTIKLLKN